MPKQLSDRQQRVIFGVVVAALVAFGIYLSLDGFSSGTEEEPEEAAIDEPSGDDAATPPRPIDVTDESDLDVFDWLPFPEDEVLTAAVVAREFAAAYGTFDYSEDEDAYYQRMAGLATEDFGDVLAQTSGAGALRGELESAETVAIGRAEVSEIRVFNDESITFVVTAQSITEDTDGESEDLGDFAVTMVQEGGEWLVYDFQPADAGDYGNVS